MENGPTKGVSCRLRDIGEEIFSWIKSPFKGAFCDFSTWTEEDWKAACMSAFVHGIGPYLFSVLSRNRDPGARLSPLFWRYLCDQHELNRQRIVRLEALHTEISGALGSSGFELLPLKGLILIRYFPEPAMRPMADLDYLVRGRDLEQISGYLLNQSFTIVEDSPRHRTFLPDIFLDQVPKYPGNDRSCPQPNTVFCKDGEHPDNPFFVELHQHVGEQFWPTRVDITGEYRKRARGMEADTALLFHLLLHAGHNTIRSTLRMIQLIDIMLVSRRMSTAHWQDLMDWSSRVNANGFVYAPLLFTRRYLGSVIPQEILKRVEADTPKSLVRLLKKRNLADLSYSNPRQASVVQTLKWFPRPEDKIRALLKLAGGLPKENKKTVAAPKGGVREHCRRIQESGRRSLSLAKRKIGGEPRKGWHVFSSMGLSKDCF